MRKNKKIIAILTLLMFAMTMILPVAANAAVNEVTLTPEAQTVQPGATVVIEGALDAAPDAGDAVYLVGNDNSIAKGTVAGATATFEVTAPAPATDADQTVTYNMVVAADNATEEDIVVADKIKETGESFAAEATVTVLAKLPITVAIDKPITVGDREVVVTFTNAEADDILRLTNPDGTVTEVTLTAAEAAAGKYTFAVPGGAVANRTYTVSLTNVSAVPVDVKKDSASVEVPDAAGEADADASYINVKDKEVKVRENSTTEISLRDENNRRATLADDNDGIYVWAEERVGQPTSALIELTENLAGVTVTPIPVPGHTNAYIYHLTGDIPSDFSVEMKYSRPGTYSVYASLANPTEPRVAGDEYYAENAAYGDVAVFKSNSRTVTVEGDKTNVVAIGVDSVNSPDNPEVILFDGEIYPSCTVQTDNVCLDACGDTGMGCPFPNWWNDGEVNGKYPIYLDQEDIACLDPIYVDPNGVTESDIDFVVYEYRDINNDGVISDAEKTADNLVAVDVGIDVTFDTSSGAIKVNKSKDTTDYNGEVDISVTGTTEGTYIIYVKAGKVEVRVPVTVAPLRADTIVKTKEPSVPLAAEETIGSGELRFQILDPSGNVIVNPFNESTVGKLNFLGLDGLRDQLDITTLTLDGNYEHVTAWSPGYEGKFVKLTKPAASDLKVTDVNFVPYGNGEFGVTFDKDLVVGDYALTITLDNGRSITFNWTMQEFGTAQELKLEYDRNTIELNGITKAPSIYFLDENGVKKDATRYVELGATGYALKHFNTATGVVQVENDEKYIGDKIKVYAVATREGLTAEAELTVTSGEGMITFDQKVGPVGVLNRVPFKIVDSEGNQLTLGADKQIMSATAVVVSQTNPDANVTANVASYTNSDILNKGAGVLNLNSDKKTNAEIKVTVVARVNCPREGYADAYITQVYSGTLDYKFGDASEFDGRIVVMTIGSTDVIVNNEIVKIDSAPFVNEDWRTMIPFRAMAESFGADVEWNEEDQTVTTELDGVTVVMTIGSETYTINGEEKTMDTAPVIQDSRTLIPVRFPAEAFGFDVVPTYNADGLTSSVLFTR